MHQAAALAGADRVGYRARAQGRGERHVAAGERLAHAHDVGRDAGVLAREQRPRAPEAGGDLVEHEQQTVLVAERSQQDHALGGVKPHPAGALDNGL